MQQQITQDLRISSLRENINLIGGLIDEICEKHEISEDHYGNILIAMTEAVTNAIVHGNKEDPAKYVNVSYTTEDDQISFTVVDEGKGFDFSNLPDPTAPENIEKPSGRGIFLMKNLADEVEFLEDGRGVKLIFNTLPPDNQ